MSYTPYIDPNRRKRRPGFFAGAFLTLVAVFLVWRFGPNLPKVEGGVIDLSGGTSGAVILHSAAPTTTSEPLPVVVVVTPTPVDTPTLTPVEPSATPDDNNKQKVNTQNREPRSTP